MKPKRLAAYVTIVTLAALAGCSSTKTAIGTDTTVGSRIGQVAITQAMDNAFSTLKTLSLNGKKVFTGVTHLGNSDNVPFQRAYFDNKIFVGGGRPLDNLEDADIRCLLLIKVGGIDEKGSDYFILSTEYVQSQFEALVTLSDDKTAALVKSQTIFGQSKIKHSGF
jgi:hypothetical protein